MHGVEMLSRSNNTNLVPDPAADALAAAAAAAMQVGPEPGTPRLVVVHGELKAKPALHERDACCMRSLLPALCDAV